MSCAAMLDQILEADLDVLEGRGDSELARHVRDCQRCRAAASFVIDDTRALGLATTAMRATIESVSTGVSARRRRPNRLNRFAAVGIAAAVTVVLVRDWQRRHRAAEALPPLAAVATAITERVAPVVVIPTAPPNHVRPVRDLRVVPSGNHELRHAVPSAPALPIIAEQTVAVPIARPRAVAPVRIDTATTEMSLGSTVDVDPPTGTRANIIRTANPSVTVVWLYR